MEKYLAPLTLALCPYLFLPLGLIPESLTYVLMLPLSFVLLAVQIRIIWINFRYPWKTDELTPVELAKWDFLIKLAHIPYFLLIFFMCLMFLIAIAVPAITMAAFTMIPWAIITDVILMLTSSCYGFSAIRRAKSEGTLSSGAALRHTIAHCIFVADVVSAFLLWRKLKKT